MMSNIQKVVSWFGANEFILGLATITGLLGFVLTVFVTIKTTRISKILKRNLLIQDYNRHRSAYAKMFIGHRDSILKDGLRTELLWTDILKTVVEYNTRYSQLSSIRERLFLWRLLHLLKKKNSDANFTKVATRLAILAGYLQKKEVKNNG